MPYRRHFIGDLERSIRDHPSRPVVLSEGDSWISSSDVIGRLDDPTGQGNARAQRARALLRLEKAGDEGLTIHSGAQRSKLRGTLKRWKIDALLFSGGGNDIISSGAGPDRLLALRAPTPADRGLLSRAASRWCGACARRSATARRASSWS